MKIKMMLFAIVFLGLLFGLSASAVTTDPSCGIVPFDKQLSYVNATQVDKFDQSLGCLKSVRLTAQACGHVVAELDSEDQTAQEFEIIALARVIPNLPNVGEQIFQIGLDETFNVAADDEPGENNANFAGPDYSGLLTVGSQADPACTDEREFIFTGAQMDPFKGNAGDKVQIPVRTQSAITVIGSVLQESRSSAFMGIEICVVYEYEPLCINGTKISDCTGLGLEDWTINLKKDGVLIDTKMTGPDGSYSFCGLGSGTYTVEEVLPAGWTQISAPGPITLDCENANGQNFRNRMDCTITTTPFSVCPGVTVTKEMILEHVTLNGCSGTPTVTIGAGNTYTVSCTSAAGCPCSASGSWTVNPACTLETTPFSVCPGVTVTKEMILEHVDTTNCTDTPTVNIGAGNTYTVSCTDENGCPCTGSGSWTVNPACTLETTPFSVCPGVTVTKEMILEHVDTTNCTDTPTVTIGAGNTYTVSCTDENGCPCTGSGSWTEYPPCIIETETFSVPCNTVPTDDEILAHVDLNSECADAPVITRGPGTTYTISCTDENGCPCSGSGSWTVEPCVETVCETAWAFLDDWKCFTKTGNWGSLTEIAPGDSLTLTGDVVAGRAKCDQTKGWVVGTATITVSADGYDLDFDLNDDCHVEDLHVWVSNTKPVVKGGFSDKRWYKFESMTGLNLDLTKPIYVAVHTETCCSACNDKEACTYPAPK